MLVLIKPHLRRILTAYFAYYPSARTHLSLEKDAPDVIPGRELFAGVVGPVGGPLALLVVRSVLWKHTTSAARLPRAAWTAAQSAAAATDGINRPTAQLSSRARARA